MGRRRDDGADSAGKCGGSAYLGESMKTWTTGLSYGWTDQRKYRTWKAGTIRHADLIRECAAGYENQVTMTYTAAYNNGVCTAADWTG